MAVQQNKPTRSKRGIRRSHDALTSSHQPVRTKLLVKNMLASPHHCRRLLPRPQGHH